MLIQLPRFIIPLNSALGVKLDKFEFKYKCNIMYHNFIIYKYKLKN